MKKLKYFLPLAFMVLACVQVLGQDYKLPKYEKFKLKNGLTVYLMEHHEVPMINVSVVLPAGAIYDGTQSGLASLTAVALKHGSQNYPKAKLDAELDFIGATLNTYASKESAGMSAKFAAKDKDKVLDIIKVVLTKPVFDATEFEKEKKRVLTNLEQAKESPRSVIGSYFDRFLYGDHVYGNTVPGQIATVSQLSVDDVKKFYNENYIPNGAAIAIVGDFNTKDMKAAVTKLFSSWPKGKSTQKNLATNNIQSQNSNRVLLINKDDAKETTFLIGSKGISRNNPDFVAIEVVNTLFGGRFTSMLNDELRVNTGLTYGARSAFNPLKNGGSFYISTFTAKETTGEAIDKALEVLDKLHKDGISEEALTSAKNYVKGQFPPDFETAGQLASLLTQMFWYNFDEKYINDFQKNVDGLTVDKARDIIAKYFPKDKLQFVMVGKAADIKEIAKKYGTVTEVDIKADVPRKAF